MRRRPGPQKPRYLQPYREAVKQTGASFESLLWRNRDFQRRRFEAIGEMVDLSGRAIADLGCGRADLLAWMDERKVAYRRYVGVEGVPELLSFSRERAAMGREGLGGAEFVEADFAADKDFFEGIVKAHNVDCLVFSGSLNTFEQGAAQDVLARAWRAIAPVGGGMLVFNFLSNRHAPHGSPDPGPAHRFDPAAMLTWALGRTSLVSLRHDYLDGHDATIAMRV